MREEVGNNTPNKEMDLDVFLWRHTWHFPYHLTAGARKLK